MLLSKKQLGLAGLISFIAEIMVTMGGVLLLVFDIVSDFTRIIFFGVYLPLIAFGVGLSFSRWVKNWILMLVFTLLIFGWYLLRVVDFNSLIYVPVYLICAGLGYGVMRFAITRVR